MGVIIWMGSRRKSTRQMGCDWMWHCIDWMRNYDVCSEILMFALSFFFNLTSNFSLYAANNFLNALALSHCLPNDSFLILNKTFSTNPAMIDAPKSCLTFVS